MLVIITSQITQLNPSTQRLESWCGMDETIYRTGQAIKKTDGGFGMGWRISFQQNSDRSIHLGQIFPPKIC